MFSVVAGDGMHMPTAFEPLSIESVLKTCMRGTGITLPNLNIWQFWKKDQQI